LDVHTGFLLTRHSRDFRKYAQVELWVQTDQGPAQLLIDGEHPVFFITQSSERNAKTLAEKLALHVQIKPLPQTTFQQEPVSGVYCQSLATSRMLASHFQQHDINVYEADIKLADRYLMERFIQGSLAFTGDIEVLNKNTPQQYIRVTNAKCKAAPHQPSLSQVSLDIECSEKGVLYSIGLASAMDNRVLMVGQPQPSETSVQWVNDEKALLQALEQWFYKFDPDIIVGWNVIDFDFKLLHKRAEIYKLKLRLGRGGQNSYFRTLPSSQQSFITLPGRVVLDGIDMLKTATYNFRSWSLESVSQQLLGEGKAIHNVHDRMDEINTMFRKDKPSLAKYNLQDCVLVNKIFAKTHLLEFAIERTKLTGIELDRLGGSVAAFSNLYLPRMHRAGYIAPNLEPETWVGSPGGYVMDSLPDLYDSVLVLDFKSLYPSIIRSFLIDPMGLIEGLKLAVGPGDEQAVEGFRGAQFHREHHFLPNLIAELWAARDIAKKNNDLPFSQAIKIIMNSFYGVLGSSGCRFFDTRLASSITMRGHEVLARTKDMIEEQGYIVIYGDTDSVFVHLGSSHSQTEADEVGNQLVETINAAWRRHLREQYNLDCFLELEYETHYRKFLMPTIRGSETGSKKRYAGVIGEGDNEQLIFKGLESVRTDWTPLSQHFQRQLYQMIFHDQDPTNYIRQVVEETLAGKHDDDLIYQKRLRRRLHDYQKNIPPQVRAARIADNINQQLGRPLQYQNRGRIEYIITLNGPEPVEYRKSSIDYQHYIDKQLKPVADAILPFIGLDFDALNAPQLGLF
jgi:DNA polymerase-2